MFQGSFKSFSVKFQGVFKRVFKNVSLVFHGSFNVVSRVFQRSFKILFLGVLKKFHVTWHSLQLPEQKEGLFTTHTHTYIHRYLRTLLLDKILLSPADCPPPLPPAMLSAAGCCTNAKM